MLRKLIEIFRRRRYTSLEQKKEFHRDSEKEIRREVKEKISNQFEVGLDLHDKEKKQRIELEVLTNVLKENPDYYAESEINKIINEIMIENTIYN